MKQLVVLIMAAGSLLAHAQSGAQPTAAESTAGEIKGTVTDQLGSPVSGATVYAIPQGLTFNDITPRSAKTDSNGRFDFRGGFPLEAYKLYSRKDEDSYPDPLDRFYADPKAEAPQVDLTEEHPSTTVTVKLGEKAAVLTGRLLDADTGAAVKANLAFVDEDGNGHHIQVDGNFRALLPTGKAITVIVRTMSPPHRAQRPVVPLRLEPGQYVSMDILVSAQ
jgi:hypothetical protein